MLIQSRSLNFCGPFDYHHRNHIFYIHPLQLKLITTCIYVFRLKLLIGIFVVFTAHKEQSSAL